MFNIVRKNGSMTKASCKTFEEAEDFLANMGPQRNFFKIEEVKEKNPVKKDKVINITDDLFKDAVEITRANVRFFYKKEGLIRVISNTGKVLHTGKTRNMGKVFSNYINCHRYNQSYDFNIESGEDKLIFKEMELSE